MIDVVIPFYKGEFFVKDLLNSLLIADRKMNAINHTTLLSRVIIIIDSLESEEDFFADLLSQFNQLNISVIRNSTNLGVGASRNIGIKAVTADYILIIDQDDLISDNYFLEMAALKNKADIIFTNGLIISNKINFKWFHLKPEFTVKSFIENFQIRSPGMYLLKASLKGLEFPEDRELSGADDKFFLINLFLQNPNLKISYTDKLLYCGRLHTSNVSNDFKKLAFACIHYWNSYKNFNYSKLEKSIKYDLAVQNHICQPSLKTIFPYINNKFSLNKVIRYCSKKFTVI